MIETDDLKHFDPETGTEQNTSLISDDVIDTILDRIKNAKAGSTTILLVRNLRHKAFLSKTKESNRKS